MRTTLERVLLVTVAICATVAMSPTASAAGSDQISGGCGFTASQNDAAGPNTFVGVIDDVSATVDATGLPVAATVSCQIQVNAVAAPGTTFSYGGFGVQAGANPISYTAGPADLVNLCQRVVYADGTNTGWVCNTMTDQCFINAPCLPEITNTLLEFVNGTVNKAFTSTIDPVLCPILAANAGTYGPVTIRSDGDVYIPDPASLGLNPVYDCLPYGNF